MEIKGEKAFPPALRLHHKREFARVMRKGVQVADGRIRLRALSREGDLPTRLGITIGRKAGKAVSRNRFRRRLREAFRCCREELPDSLDLVVFPVTSPGWTSPPVADLRESLVALARRARDRIRNQGRAKGRAGGGGTRRGVPR